MALVLVVPGAALWLHRRGFREVDPTGLPDRPEIRILPDGSFLAAAGVWDGRLGSTSFGWAGYLVGRGDGFALRPPG